MNWIDGFKRFEGIILLMLEILTGYQLMPLVSTVDEISIKMTLRSVPGECEYAFEIIFLCKLL